MAAKIGSKLGFPLVATTLAEAAAHGHLTAAQAATIAAGAKVNALALTHFSQRYETLEGFVDEARPIHANVIALEDGTAVAVSRRDVKAGAAEPL